MADQNELIEALNAESNGDWDRAHRIVQDRSDPKAAWIHAFLHRIEGDEGNAAHWYARAGKPVCTDSLDAERESIRAALR